MKTINISQISLSLTLFKAVFLNVVMCCSTLMLTAQDCPSFSEAQSAEQYIENNDFETYFSKFNALSLSEVEQDKANGLFGVSLVRYEKQNFVEAIEKIEKAIKVYPKCGKYHYYKAKYTASVGGFLEALTSLKKAEDFGYNNMAILKQRAECKLGLGDIKAALKDAEELYSITRSPEDHLLKAKILLEKKEEGKAIEIINDVISKQPEIAEAHFIKAICLLKQKDIQGCLESYNIAAILDDKYLDAKIVSGIEHYLSDEKDEACNVWKKVNKISKPLADVYLDMYCK